MRIKDLPKKLRQLAFYRSRQQFIRNGRNVKTFYKNYTLKDSLYCFFIFEETPEGHDFWAAVNDGLITELPK